MNHSIISFISKQRTATVCTINESGNPYCFSCFFAFDAENAVLFYKTQAASHHAAFMRKRKEVAGTILPDKPDPVIVKGIQFEGELLTPDHALAARASKIYHLKYPFALAIPGEIQAIRMDHIKMTDSSKGFGKKAEWRRVGVIV